MMFFFSIIYSQAVASMVEECCRFVNQTPDEETKLKFIDTLRTVTEGKVRLLSVLKMHLLHLYPFSDLCWGSPGQADHGTGQN